MSEARPTVTAPARVRPPGAGTQARDWLAASKLGLVVMALVVGAIAGLGAAGFRDLIYLCTWLFTGRRTYGQLGHTPSLHLPLLGIWFVVAAPGGIAATFNAPLTGLFFGFEIVLKEFSGT